MMLSLGLEPPQTTKTAHKHQAHQRQPNDQHRNRTSYTNREQTDTKWPTTRKTIIQQVGYALPRNVLVRRGMIRTPSLAATAVIDFKPRSRISRQRTLQCTPVDVIKRIRMALLFPIGRTKMANLSMRKTRLELEAGMLSGTK